METDSKLKMTPAMSAAADENALLLDSLHKVTRDLLSTQQTLAATKTELSTTQEDLFHTADQLIQANNSVSLLQTEVNDLRAEKLIAITTAGNTKNKKGKKQQQQQQQQEEQEKDSKLAAFQKWHNAIKPPSILRAKLKQRSPTDKDALIKKLQRELSSKESRLNIQRTQLNKLREELKQEKEYSALLHREGSRLLTQKCKLEQQMNETLVGNRALKDKNKYWVENHALKRENRVLRKRNRALKDKNRVLKDLLGDGMLVTNWRRLKEKKEQYRDWREKVDGLLEGAGNGDEEEDGDDDEDGEEGGDGDGDVDVTMDEEAYVDVKMDEDENEDGEDFPKANEAGVRSDNGDGDEEGENQVEERGEEQVAEQVEVGVVEQVEEQVEEDKHEGGDRVEPKDEDEHADGEKGGDDNGGHQGSEYGVDTAGREREDRVQNGDGKEDGDGHGSGDRAGDGNKDHEGERKEDESTKADEAVYLGSRLELQI